MFVQCVSVCVCVCCWGEGSSQGSCTGVVCCCLPQQMESANIFIRPCGSSQPPHCEGRPGSSRGQAENQAALLHPTDFLLIPGSQDRDAFGQNIYGALVRQAPVKSALGYWQRWLDFIYFPFVLCSRQGHRDRERGTGGP